MQFKSNPYGSETGLRIYIYMTKKRWSSPNFYVVVPEYLSRRQYTTVFKLPFIILLLFIFVLIISFQFQFVHALLTNRLFSSFLFVLHYCYYYYDDDFDFRLSCIA